LVAFCIVNIINSYACTRISRDVNSEVTRYVYDRGNIVLETDGGYRIRATNVRDSRQLIYRETGDNTYFYQFNGHGDVTKLLDLSGSTIKDYSYDPYGNEKFSLAPSFGGNVSTTLWQAEESTIDNPFRYCGEYLDLSSGFYYLRARDYDPATQRFLTEDSYSGQVAEPLSLNLYSYCQGNPVNFIDPSGHVTQDDKDKLSSGEIIQEQYDEILKYTDMYNSIDEIDGLSENQKEFTKNLIHQQAELYRVSGYGLLKRNGRTSDFRTLTVNAGGAIGGAFTITWDNYKRVYLGVGIQGGKSLTGVSASFTRNWIELPSGNEPKKREVYNFCTGISYGASGGAGTGAGVSGALGQPGYTVSYGFFTPQIGASVTEADEINNIKRNSITPKFTPKPYRN